jgi:hypothetical protein
MNIRKDIIIRPKCECHGEEMFWHKDLTRKNDGKWECKAKRREARKRRYNTPKYKESKRNSDKRYSQTEKGKRVHVAANKRYRETTNGYMKSYLSQRNRQLGAAKSKAESELKDIHKQLKELGLEPRQK